MALTKITMPLDLTGTKASNYVLDEPHVIGITKYRAFCLNYGPFFYDSVIVKEKGSTTPLVLGEDYHILYDYPELSALCGGKRIAGVIVITNDNLGTEIIVSAQMLGGHYRYYAEGIQNAINTLELDNRNVYWANVISKPDLFQPVSHSEDIGNVFGMEYMIDLLSSINESILVGDNAVHNQIYAYIASSLDAIQVLIEAHMSNYDNPHQLDASSVGAYSTTEIDKKLLAVYKTISDLDPRFKAITDNLAIMQTAISTINNSLTGFSNRIGNAESDINTLKTTIANTNDTVNSFNNSIDNINASIATINSKVTNLQSRMGAAESNLTNQTNWNNAQDVRLGNIESKNTTQDQRLNNLESSNSGVWNNFSNYVPWSSVNNGGWLWSHIVNKIPLINSSGNMEIGNQLAFHTSNSADSPLQFVCQYSGYWGGWEIYNTGYFSAIDYYVRSDIRDKKILNTLTPEECAAIMREMPDTIRYTMFNEEKPTIGFPAQGVALCLPEATSLVEINKAKETRYTIRNTAILATLASAWKQHDNQIQQLLAEIAELKQALKK